MANFSAGELQKLRAEEPYFAKILSDNSFWVPHSPHHLAQRNRPNSLLRALERRQAAFAAFREQQGSSAPSQQGANRRPVNPKDLADFSYDAMLEAARTRNVGSLVELARHVLGDALADETVADVVVRLMKDKFFAAAAVHSIVGVGLVGVMAVARGQLPRREYRALCQVAVTQFPLLVTSPIGPLLRTYRGGPAENEHALIERAVSTTPYLFAFLEPDARRNIKLIRRLEAHAGLRAGHLDPEDQRNPDYVRRLYEAQLFRNEPFFLSCAIKTQVAPPADLYGRLDRYQLSDAMEQDAYRSDPVLVRQAMQREAFPWYRGNTDFALCHSESIGPHQVPNNVFLNALVTEQGVDSATRRRWYDQYARFYGLKTAALEKDYGRWRANVAMFGTGALLALCLEPRLGVLLLPLLIKIFEYQHKSSLWSLSDVVKPPWQRPVPLRSRTLEFDGDRGLVLNDVEVAPAGGSPAS